MILPETVLYDLQYGVRVLTRNPGATIVTVLALALGIGVNTAVFTGYKAMVARPLDAQAPSEMVNIALKRDVSGTQTSFSYFDYALLRDSVHSLNGLIAFRPSQLTFSDGRSKTTDRTPASGTALGRLGLLRSGVGSAEFASVFVVSENYFQVLGVKMLQGRGFESMGADELAKDPAVLITENYWQKRFQGDPGTVGKTIYLNGTAVTIAGITPHDFCGTGIGAPAFWLPISEEPLVHADDHWLNDRENQRYRLFARLASGATMSRVQAEISPLAEHLRTLHDPRSDWAKAATVLVWPGSPFPQPLKDYGGLILCVLLIMAAAGMVLAVACANVGSLQLARARSRENELRTRMSLGASRLRVIRQLVTESALVGMLAGALAFLFTWAMLKAATVAMANAFPGEYGAIIFDVTPDLEIFGFVSAISLVAGMLSGLAPAMQSSKAALHSAVGGGTAPVRSRRLQDVLVGAQVALSLVLMIAASMAIRSSMRAVAIDTGYETKQVLALDVQFPETLKYDAERRRPVLAELRRRVEIVPGVAAVTSARPPNDGGFRTAAETLDRESPSGRKAQTILQYAFVQSNYFETLGIPLILGGSFAGRADRSVVISESAAKELWPDQNPLGRKVRLGATDERLHRLDELVAAGLAYQVVGVARDTRTVEFQSSGSKRVYLPIESDRLWYYPILVRTRSDPQPVVTALDPLLTSIDPNLMANCFTLEESLRQSAPFIVASLAAIVSSSIGLLGFVLAVMGIYGTVSYIVVLRTKEVGIRMAIGAQKRDVLGLILRESARPLLAGLIVGTLLAAGAAHLARGLLFGLDGLDGISSAGVSLMFLSIGLLASYPPARRATRVDPLVALRDL